VRKRRARAHCLSEVNREQTETNPVKTEITVIEDDSMTYHPVCSEPSLDEAREDVRWVVAVVGDAAQAGVDGDHH